MNAVLIVFVALMASAFAVWIFRKLAAGSSLLLDVPNERSSHAKAVTRGAGIAIVVTVLGVYLIISGTEANLAYILAAVAIATVSFVDDLYSVPLLIRLVIHVAASTYLVSASGAYTSLTPSFLNYSLNFGGLAPLVTVVFVVWTTNAFNFMDGIDGLAGAQGVGAGFGWLLLGLSTGIATYSTLGAAILGSCIGFLVFNWQPAKVFMGDVGSTFLGFTLGSIPIVDAQLSSEDTSLTAAVIMLWLFMFDTIFTRIRFVLRLRSFWRPHREHLYQQVVQSGSPHYIVSAFFGVFAVVVAIALAAKPKIGVLPVAILLVLGPAVLFFWPRKLSTSKSPTHVD